GGAVAGRPREAAAADGPHRGGGGRGRPVRQRRHDRVPARQGRQLLLHGDEHADPGRARRHRARDGPRPREGADPRRRRRGAVVLAEGRHLLRPRARVPDQRRGSVELHALAGHDPPLLPARRPGRARGHLRARGLRDLAVLRQHDRQADDPRPHACRGDRAHEALARRDGGRGHQDQHPAPPQDPRRPRLRGGALRHRLHGALPAPEEGDRGLVTEGAARTSASRFERLLPLLLVPVALFSDPGAALPLRSYYFRDFSTAFYPLRLFQARELAAGRLPTWNPFVFEGTFLAPGPALYPLDLLIALRPSPSFVSWLLTLHLPLAALGAYWLARQLSASRKGAFAAGAVYALSGLTLSSLNLYLFLQALALAPFVAGLLRRAALEGGRSVVWAAAAVALGLSTYTVEFVGQAVLLGLALGLAERRSWQALLRMAASLALGVGLAGVPIALVAGVLPETARGAGFAGDVALANAVQPVVLLQTLVPHLFGFPEAPAQAFWGGRFFSKGLPYFLTLYLGPLTLALAAIGVSRIERRARLVLLGLAGVALLYALGNDGGLAPLLHRLGLSGAFRFPSKALLLPQIAVALAAGFGFGRVAEDRAALSRLAVLTGVAAGLALALFALVAAKPAALVAWSGVLPAFWPQLTAVVGRDVAIVVLLALVVAVVLWLATRNVLSPAQ